MSVCGVYQIKFIPSGLTYIGRSVHIQRRWAGHRHELRKGMHKNPKLQAYWSKYGEDCFEFSVLQEVARDEELLSCAEQQHLDTVPQEKRFNFGPCSKHPQTGTHKSPESKEKMRAAKLGSVRTEEKRHLSEFHKGKPKGLGSVLKQARTRALYFLVLEDGMRFDSNKELSLFLGLPLGKVQRGVRKGVIDGLKVERVRKYADPTVAGFGRLP